MGGASFAPALNVPKLTKSPGRTAGLSPNLTIFRTPTVEANAEPAQVTGPREDVERPLPAEPGTDRTHEFHVTGTAALQWRPNDDNLVYLRYSRGYKAGGFNLGFVPPDRLESKFNDCAARAATQLAATSASLSAAQITGLGTLSASLTTAQLEALNAAGVPCGRVMNLREVFDDPQIRHQRMKITIDHPRIGRKSF